MSRMYLHSLVYYVMCVVPNMSSYQLYMNTEVTPVGDVDYTW